MVEREGDVKFTFDASSFKAGVKDIVNSMGKINDNTKNMTEKIGKGMTGAFNKFALKAVAVFAGIKAGMLALTHGIPEIGQTLSIAGQIITRNLLWPLRKELIPMLNKILVWVRKHRKEFIVFGGVIANAFKMIKGIFSAIATAVSPIVNVIKNLFSSIFGNTAQSFSDTMNLIMFKITAFAMMVGSVVKPFFTAVSEALTNVIANVKVFGSSFLKSMRETFKNNGGFSSFVDNMSGSVKNLTDAMKLLFGASEQTGSMLGGGFADGLKLVGQLLNAITEDVKILVMLLTGDFKGAMDEFSGYREKVQTKLKKEREEVEKRFAPSVSDTDIFGNKKVPLTIPETYSAIPTFIPRQNKNTMIPVSINFGDFNVTTTEGNAVKAGQGVIQGVEQQMRGIILDTLVTQGNR
jgi:hypothetical protein